MDTHDAKDEVSVVLASSSPRRRALLAMAGFTFVVEPPQVDEVQRPGEPPTDMVVRLAREKVIDVIASYDDDANVVVVGADTAVLIDDQVLGKPTDEAEAASMLQTIAGRKHTVITGYALFTPPEIELASGSVRTTVEMHEVTNAQAHGYAATGEPMDKAGAYALQGEGARFVRSVDGSRSNVVGLPLVEIVPLLEAAGAVRRRM